MQKTDEMSSNFIKLQMKLESKEEEYELSLIKAKEDAFAEGIEVGVSKALSDSELQLNSKIEIAPARVLKESKSIPRYFWAIHGHKDYISTAKILNQKGMKRVKVIDMYDAQAILYSYKGQK
jgi:flagellar assembly protein FliH